MGRNSLSKAIDAAGPEARHDECVKRILSHLPILARLLKGCVDEFKDVPVERIEKECIEKEPQISTVAVDQDDLDADEAPGGGRRIKGLNTEDSSIKEGKIFYDIRFTAVAPGTKEPIPLIINIEAQNTSRDTRLLLRRSIYYVDRMVSAQKNTVFTGNDYKKIRKVYSIWILTDAPKKESNTIKRYKISEELVVGSVSAPMDAYDVQTIVMLRLGPQDQTEPGSILRLLDVLISSGLQPAEKKAILIKDFDVPMTTSLNEEVNEMCNLAEGIREKAEKRGEKRATLETRLEDVLNLMKSLKMSAEDALDALRVPLKSRNALLKSINERLAAE